MEVLLANPRGFCAGVLRAVSIVERALELFGAPIYVRHEVVHNKYVVERLRSLGAVFVNELNAVPDDATVIFSAHGVSLKVRNEALRRNLKVFDATCPLVTKVHMQVSRASRKGIECILIGHKGHPEVEGTMGQYCNEEGGIYLVQSVEDVQQLKLKNENEVTFVTQTTLSMDETKYIIDALQAMFPSIERPRKEDICYATQNRQDAVKELAHHTDMIFVVGSKTSSNSNRLKELADRLGTPAKLIDSIDDIIDDEILPHFKVGITAGASAPEVLVQQVVKYLENLGDCQSHNLEGREENVVFYLPTELR